MKKYSLAKKLSCVIAGIICFAVPLNASAANLPEQKKPFGSGPRL